MRDMFFLNAIAPLAISLSYNCFLFGLSLCSCLFIGFCTASCVEAHDHGWRRLRLPPREDVKAWSIFACPWYLYVVCFLGCLDKQKGGPVTLPTRLWISLALSLAIIAEIAFLDVCTEKMSTVATQREMAACKEPIEGKREGDLELEYRRHITRCMNCGMKLDENNGSEQMLSEIGEDRTQMEGELQDWTLLE